MAAGKAQAKKEFIRDFYTRDYEYIDVYDLSLRDTLYLHTLSRHSLSEDYSFVEPFIDKPPLAPRFDDINNILKHLYAQGLIAIGASSPVEAFVFNKAGDEIEAYYPRKVVWDFLPAMVLSEKPHYLQSAIKLAKDTWNDEWAAEVTAIWHEISKAECIEYFLYLLSQRDYVIDGIGTKTNAIFDELLSNFSVSQIFNLSWQAVRDVTDYNVRNNLPRYKGKNVFIGGIQRKAEKALAEGWEVRHSRRDFNCPQTVLSSTFFNLFLEIGDRAFQTVLPKRGEWGSVVPRINDARAGD